MAPYEALYGRSCRSPVCWTEVGERSTTGSELISDTSVKVELIRKHLLTAQSRQKSYADTRLLHMHVIEHDCELEFQDEILLRKKNVRPRKKLKF